MFAEQEKYRQWLLTQPPDEILSHTHHNAVFIGDDTDSKARYDALRGTTGSYRGEVAGNDKWYSFSIAEKRSAETVHLFESAIDLMS